MNREIQQKITTMKKLRLLRVAHANESQYVKYCGMEETTKLLKLRLNMIKFDSTQLAFLRWANVGSTLYSTMTHVCHTMLSQRSFNRWFVVGSTLLYNDGKTL